MERYLITGASRGIGRAIATKLAAPDVMLLLHGRDTIALAETCRAVEKSGGEKAKIIYELAHLLGIDDLVVVGGHKASYLLVKQSRIVAVKPAARTKRQAKGRNN